MSPASTAEYATGEFYASRHPVRRFVAGLVAVATALVLVWWTGVLAPRLSAESSSVRFDRSTGRGVLEIEVSNEAPTPVRLRDVEIPVAGLVPTTSTVDGIPLDARPEIGGRETAVLRLEYRSDGCIGETQAEAVWLRVRVRTVTGVTRSEGVYAVFSTARPTSLC